MAKILLKWLLIQLIPFLFIGVSYLNIAARRFINAEQFKNSALIYSSIYFYGLKIISLESVLNFDYCKIYFILVLTSIKEEIAK